jgi:hypothetical protein
LCRCTCTGRSDIFGYDDLSTGRFTRTSVFVHGELVAGTAVAFAVVCTGAGHAAYAGGGVEEGGEGGAGYGVVAVAL